MTTITNLEGRVSPCTGTPSVSLYFPSNFAQIWQLTVTLSVMSDCWWVENQMWREKCERYWECLLVRNWFNYKGLCIDCMQLVACLFLSLDFSLHYFKSLELSLPLLSLFLAFSIFYIYFYAAHDEPVAIVPLEKPLSYGFAWSFLIKFLYFCFWKSYKYFIILFFFAFLIFVIRLFFSFLS